jgi:hypothetical protein
MPVAEDVAPEYVRFVAAQRQATRAIRPPVAMAPGDLHEPIQIDPESAGRLLAVAAKRASGLYRPTKRTEVVWVLGDSELAVGVDDVHVRTSDGLVVVTIPVRCDQIEPSHVTVTFAVGAPGRPAGMYASTQRVPRGPAVVVDNWGAALVAFAWQCVLGMISGIAGAVGKDERGNVLVPAELEATADGLRVIPMARHRFTSR